MPRPIVPALLILGAALVSAGCTSGRVAGKVATGDSPTGGAQLVGNLPALVRCAGRALPADSPNRSNSLFVHPGLLLSNLDWDRSLAMEAGDFLRDKAYAGRVVEVRDRSAAPVLDHMTKDPGTQFVGIHYSMGGNPHYLRSSIEATREASRIRQTQLRYHAVMIDPSGIGEVENVLDVEAPEVGYLFVILSSERSMLRPGITGFSQRLLDSGKVHVMYAEDFGEDWNHFGMLEALRTFKQDGNAGGRKVEALLEYLVSLALGSTEKLPSLPGPCGSNESSRIAARQTS